MREITLSRGRGVVLLDDADYERVRRAGPWHLRPGSRGRSFYAQRKTGHTTEQLHRFLTGWPYVDHINGNGLDNQRHNLRAATHQQNCRNRGPKIGGTSQFKGVSWRTSAGMWLAQIRDGRRSVWLGTYADEEEAARVYDAAALKLFGEFAWLNYPEESNR